MNIAPPPPTRRIALVTETYLPEVNGVALTLARLVDGLRRRDWNIQLIRPRQGRRDCAATESGFNEWLMPGLPIPGYPGLRFGLPVTGRLRRLWAEQRPDLVHVVTEGPLGAAAVAAARQLRLPVTSGFHTNFHAYSRHYRLGWLHGLMAWHLRRFHRRTLLTLAPTEALAQTLQTQGYGPTAALARGVDTELFRPTRRSPALRLSWGIDDDAPAVIYVGRLAAEKNLGLVVAAFAAIRERVGNARLILVGDGPLAGRLARRHPEYHFAGLRRGEDLAAHYASADLFLFPSLTETFGNVVPEALASGLAVVAYDHAAAADLIDNGDNGRTIAAGDRAAFIAAAVELASRPESLAELRRRAAASVADLDWQKIHDRFAALLGAVADRHHGGHHDPQQLILQPD